MFSAGRKPHFNTVCSWLFQESPKNFNLPLPQLKCSPLTPMIQWGLKHGPAVPIQPVLVRCAGSFKVRKTGDDECRFHFLMSTGRFQAHAFCPARQGHFGKVRLVFVSLAKSSGIFNPFVSVTQQFLMWKKTDGHINATTVRPSWSLLLA